MMEGLVKDYGIKAQAVNFTGGGPWNTALGQGTVEMGWISEGAAVGLGDKLRPLAVTGETRSKHWPDTPTFKELGRPDYRGLVISLNTRAGTPKVAIDKLYAAAAAAMKVPEVRTRLQNAGFELIDNSTPQTAAQHLASQYRFFEQIAKSVGSGG